MMGTMFSCGYLLASLCFQALPFLMDFNWGLVDTAKSSTVLVISPLVTLMIDQVKSLDCVLPLTSLSNPAP